MCGRDKRGGVVHEVLQSEEDGSWRSVGFGDGSDGDDDGVKEMGLRKREEPSRPDWQMGCEHQGGVPPANTPSLKEVVGRTTWRRSDGGKDCSGGGGRSGGGVEVTERIGSVSQQLSAVMPQRGNCSHLPLACRVCQKKPQGLLNPLSLLFQNHHPLPASCRMTRSRCGMGGEVEVSDGLRS